MRQRLVEQNRGAADLYMYTSWIAWFARGVGGVWSFFASTIERTLSTTPTQFRVGYCIPYNYPTASLDTI